MTRNLIAATATAALLLAAGSASAQTVTGTINLTGSVAPKCNVTAGGAGSSFGADVLLGELAGADGLLLPALAALQVGGSTSKSFSVKCTASKIGVSVTSTALTNAAVTTAPTGYTNAVDFIGSATFDLVGGGSPATVSDATGGTSTAGALTSFLANSADNVRVSAHGFNTPSSPLLVAGNYAGSIVVVLTPST